MSEHKHPRDTYKGNAYRRKLPPQVTDRRDKAAEKQAKYLAWFEEKYGAAGQRRQTKREEALEVRAEHLTGHEIWVLGHYWREERRANRKRRMHLRARRGRGAC